MTLDEAAADNATLVALLVAAVIAVAILIPSLGYLYKLVLTGRLDQEFHPIGASDPETDADEVRRQDLHPRGRRRGDRRRGAVLLRGRPGSR